jgi:hypothetical protein
LPTAFNFTLGSRDLLFTKISDFLSLAKVGLAEGDIFFFRDVTRTAITRDDELSSFWGI